MKRIIIAIIAGFCLHAVPAWANQLKGLRVAPAAEKTRIVFDMAERPIYSYSITEQPAQLIVDLKSVSSSTARTERTNKLGPVVRSVRRANSPVAGAVRLIFELNSTAPLQVFTLGPQLQYGHRLVIDLSHSGKGQAIASSGNGRASSTSSAPSGKPVSGRIIPMSGEPATPSVNAAASSTLKAGMVSNTTTRATSTAASRLPSSEVKIKEEVISTEVRRTSSVDQPSVATRSTQVASNNGAPVRDSVASRNDPRVKPYLPEHDIVPGPSAKAQAEPVVSRTQPVSTTSGDVVIAVDAGHGGKDPGAIGQNGTYEKHVTLAIARELTAMINRQPGMKAVMTRTGDYFVDLDARSEIARRQKAQLLISIHADSVDNATARGASVWILSNKRVDREMNKLLEQQDKHTQLLGGAGKVIAEAEPNPYLAQTILDLSWDNSRSEGYNIGEEVLNQIGRVARLHKSKPVHASLAVLKAPDIPSLLIETGFISNHFEEKQLSSHAYQRQIATAIFRGVRGYYAENAPEGSVRVASRQTAAKSVSENRGEAIRHVVSSGESLSGLAQRYGVSKRRLRDHNSLKSENLLIGQVLYIPAS